MNTYELYDARQDYRNDNMELNKENSAPSPERSTVMIYAIVTVLCFFFAKGYGLLSHGVSSPYMTYLFAPPLVLGWLPSFLAWRLPAVRRAPLDGPDAETARRAGPVCRNAWHSGVAAVTASCLLRGIFEIAGTASPLQSALMGAGIAMLLTGLAAWILRK